MYAISAGARELEVPPGATQRPLPPGPQIGPTPSPASPSAVPPQEPHSCIWAQNTTVRPRV